MPMLLSLSAAFAPLIALSSILTIRQHKSTSSTGISLLRLASQSSVTPDSLAVLDLSHRIALTILLAQ